MSSKSSSESTRPMYCAIVTASDTRIPSNDTSGNLLEHMLTEEGHIIVQRDIIREDFALLQAHISQLIAHEQIEVICISGGTGITLRDSTPEVLQVLGTKEIPGFGELFRWLSYQDIASSTIQSRACAWLCQDTLAFALPGSPSAVQLALEKILIPQLDIQHKPCNFAQLMNRIRVKNLA
jgi:molybdopterin adenylyltransferase